MTTLKVKNRQLGKLREFRKGMNIEDYLSTELRQVFRALENQFVDQQDVATEVASNSSDVESSTCGNFSTATTADVTNLSVTITTTGGNVIVALKADGLFASQLGCLSSSAACLAYFNILRDNVIIASHQVSMSATGATNTNVAIPSSSVLYNDRALAAGTYTYKIQADPSIGTAFLRNTKLYAYESF
jgi:hypothetical protein